MPTRTRRTKPENARGGRAAQEAVKEPGPKKPDRMKASKDIRGAKKDEAPILREGQVVDVITAEDGTKFAQWWVKDLTVDDDSVAEQRPVKRTVRITEAQAKTLTATKDELEGEQ